MARSLRATFSRSYFLWARSYLIFLVLALASRFFVSTDYFEDYDPESLELDEDDPEDEELEPDEEEKHEGEED